MATEPAGAQLVEEWWRGASGAGEPLYRRLRSVPDEAWSEAVEGLPADDGPELTPAPDRPTPRIADLPEVQALRAELQDRRVAFDTIERWIRALTVAAQAMGDKRPLEWSAEDVAGRCASLAEGGEGGLWSMIEAARELWAWHPDRPYAESQAKRLRAFLEAALGAGEDAAGGAS